MPGIGHLGVALAAGPLAPDAPLAALLVASEVTDLLAGIFALAGVEGGERTPWSHSLATSVGVSALTALAAGAIFRSRRTGTVAGLVALSHWALDFVVWKDALPLLGEGSRRVGLGLYGCQGVEDLRLTPQVAAMEFGLPLLGLGIYLWSRARAGREESGGKGVE